MVAYGEENRDWGGAFAVYRGLTEAMPYHRLFNTSISEGAIVGTALKEGGETTGPVDSERVSELVARADEFR